MTVDRDRAMGAMLGLAIGDALGAPLEFSARDSKPAVRDMIGGGPFALAPGQWTDDTAMALCLADAVIAGRGALDPADLMRRFLRWWRHGENSATGDCSDIGGTTQEALAHFERTGQTAGALPEDVRAAGNGSLMRLAPVAIVAAPDIVRAADLADAQSRTTHRASVAHDACLFFATLLVEAMCGADKREILRAWRYAAASDLAPLARAAYRTKTRDEISSSGYVVHTLEAALWAVWHAESFEEALILAVNLGRDADTVGAVTGQLAGALWGQKAIPERWLSKLAWRETIEARVDALLAAGR